MAKPKRKTRSDKFPLTKHPTGQYCKKIKGKLYYFGSDKSQALERYLEQAHCLHTGEPANTGSRTDNLSIKTMCNLYLDHLMSRTAIGELRPRHVPEKTLLLRAFAKFVGPDQLVSAVSILDLQNFRTRLIRAGLSGNTINCYLAAVKAMYNWAFDNEVIGRLPRLRAVKKLRSHKIERPTFTASQIWKLLENARVQMKAMIWLGLNCGFGCTDCAELKWKSLDLENGRVAFPRGKTGIDRNLPLWPETIKALKELPISGELVFYTKRGNPWVTYKRVVGKDGRVKYTRTDSVTRAFSDLMKKTGIKMEKGVGFYTLRRTAATLTARSGDPFAVQRLLGHADLKMATTYVQDVSEQTDRAINNTRKLIIQDDSSPLADASSETDE